MVTGAPSGPTLAVEDDADDSLDPPLEPGPESSSAEGPPAVLLPQAGSEPPTHKTTPNAAR
jgi:hypothetical protein